MRPEKDHSVGAEPHQEGSSFQSDGSESGAERKLQRDHAKTDAAEERAKHSVFDEPAIFPNRTPFLIQRDWYCRNCGYNLRGLMTGSPCPECGVVERYEPPRDKEAHYAQWVDSQRRESRALHGWFVVFASVLTAVPLAAFCSLVGMEQNGVLFFSLFAPAAVEIAKVVACAMIVERGAMISHPAMIYVAAIGTALVFGAVQNLIWLNTAFPNSPIELVAWRWTVCLFLHVALSTISARGLVEARANSIRTGQPVVLADSHGAIGTAIVLHIAINALAFFGGFTGYGI